MQWYHWVIIVLATWLLVSPWVLGFVAINLATWNNLFVGVLLLLAVISSISLPHS